MISNYRASLQLSNIHLSVSVSTDKPFFVVSVGPFAQNGHMVRNLPYWMAKEYQSLQNKATLTSQT